MNPQPHSRQHGLSLVELLLGLAIGALVMAPLVPLLENANAATRIAGERLALERDASFALARIATRIRATAPSITLQDSASTEWLKPAVYSVVDGSLVEQLDGNVNVLAEAVTDFRLSAPPVAAGRPVIQVSLSLARGDAATTATTTVRMGSKP
jgi:prepilin-type N-terminal cleavage/methylation domain-containing protein